MVLHIALTMFNPLWPLPGQREKIMSDIKGLFLLSEYAYDTIYGHEDRQRIGALVDIVAPPLTQELIAAQTELLEPVEIIFSGWGAPKIDAAFLAHAPNLKMIFYGSGSIYRFATEEMWQRGIRVTTAAEVNAVPVAEYVLSQILFGLKLGWQLALGLRDTKQWPSRETDATIRQIPGAYQSTVGLVSLGAISAKLIELLKPFDLNVLVCSKGLTAEQAKHLGVESVGLEELFQRSDIVSLHQPATQEHLGTITGELVLQMKRGATLINSARGAVICQQELVEVLRLRPDLMAVLDVTDPEPPAPDSELFSVPNIVLTPHIAGSVGRECERMGRAMAEELDRYLAGVPLRYEITKDEAFYEKPRKVLEKSRNPEICS
jgi:phosphoglycerate dehydrogenase-like enzyme